MNCGVYIIENKHTGKMYVGSSNNISSRINKHFLSLSKNIHHSAKLQRSYNKHGKDAFVTKPVIYCDKENKYLYEQLFIDFYDSANHGYNINKKAEKGYSKPLEEVNDLFFSSRVKVNSLGCWIFTGALAGNGMAKVKRGGKFISLQRLSYEYYVSSIPDGMLVYRTCKDRACVNPLHLNAGTKSDISKNMFHTGYSHPRGYTKLTDEQVKEIKISQSHHKELANIYNVNEKTIKDILNNKTWKHIATENNLCQV